MRRQGLCRTRWSKAISVFSPLNLFGLFTVTLMLVFHALEHRSPWNTLWFAVACVGGSIYGFLQGAWPIGLVEAVWTGISVWRFAQRRNGDFVDENNETE